MKIAINHATLFDGCGTVLQDASILFDQQQILQVAQGPLAGDVTLDGTGKTVTPGLFDCHVHLGMDYRVGSLASGNLGEDAQIAAVVASQARKAWRYGITTLRNCGTKNDIDIKVRDLIRQGVVPGARIVACGRTISITGGHAWAIGHQCDTPEEVRKAARVQIRQGADMIKLFATGGVMTPGSVPNAPQLTEEQMRVAVQEAEALGLLTAAHATGLRGAQNAIRAGVRSIEHVMVDEETARMMKERGTWYVSTIAARYAIVNSTHPALEYARKKCKPQDLDQMVEALRWCRQYGVPIAAGTDAADDLQQQIGPSLKTELCLYAKAGYTPAEILRAATGDAARMCRLDQVTGSLRPGLAADLAVFDADPLQDPANLGQVGMTFQGGRLCYRRPFAP